MGNRLGDMYPRKSANEHVRVVVSWSDLQAVLTIVSDGYFYSGDESSIGMRLV